MSIQEPRKVKGSLNSMKYLFPEGSNVRMPGCGLTPLPALLQ